MNENTAISTLTPEQAEIIPAVIQQVLGPVMAQMTELLRNNTEALTQLAHAQQIQSDRMAALEKQIRLNTLVTPQQVRYINDAIRARARELLYKRGIDSDKAIRKLGNAIRKSVLSRYGVAALHEIPKHEYSVTMNHVSTWNDMLCVRDVVKEARSYECEKAALEGAEPAASMDAAPSAPRQMDQPHKYDMRHDVGG